MAPEAPDRPVRGVGGHFNRIQINQRGISEFFCLPIGRWRMTIHIVLSTCCRHKITFTSFRVGSVQVYTPGSVVRAGLFGLLQGR